MPMLFNAFNRNWPVDHVPVLTVFIYFISRITSERSLKEMDSSTIEIKDVSWNISPSPPPSPVLSESTLMKINQRHIRNPKLRLVTLLTWDVCCSLVSYYYTTGNDMLQERCYFWSSDKAQS